MGLGRCETVVATDQYCAKGIVEQTRNMLTELTSILERAGSGKAGLLQATVYLADVRQKPQMDSVWIEWVGPEQNWPQRACVGVDLDEGYLIEVVVTARVL